MGTLSPLETSFDALESSRQLQLLPHFRNLRHLYIHVPIPSNINPIAFTRMIEHSSLTLKSIRFQNFNPAHDHFDTEVSLLTSSIFPKLENLLLCFPVDGDTNFTTLRIALKNFVHNFPIIFPSIMEIKFWPFCSPDFPSDVEWDSETDEYNGDLSPIMEQYAF